MHFFRPSGLNAREREALDTMLQRNQALDIALDGYAGHFTFAIADAQPGDRAFTVCLVDFKPSGLTPVDFQPSALTAIGVSKRNAGDPPNDQVGRLIAMQRAIRGLETELPMLSPAPRGWSSLYGEEPRLAINREEDKAGAYGIPDPIKSRFPSDLDFFAILQQIFDNSFNPS